MALQRFILYSLCALVLVLAPGCTNMVNYIAGAERGGNAWKGITYYIGGAGPIGHVGSYDVPTGLRDAGYAGYVEVYTWQSMTHAGDQINLERNRLMAAELAVKIKEYRRSYPKAAINIVALSAGTGIATFALEYLPEHLKVDNVIFLGCSLSSGYDLTRALRRVRGNLYVLYSSRDLILKEVVWYTGTVDRSEASEGVAGLLGFELPHNAERETEREYRKLRNIPYRSEFAEASYEGGHTDATKRSFVREYLADVLMGRDGRLIGDSPRKLRRHPAPTSRPASSTSQPWYKRWAKDKE